MLEILKLGKLHQKEFLYYILFLSNFEYLSTIRPLICNFIFNIKKATSFFISYFIERVLWFVSIFIIYIKKIVDTNKTYKLQIFACTQVVYLRVIDEKNN